VLGERPTPLRESEQEPSRILGRPSVRKMSTTLLLCIAVAAPTFAADPILNGAPPTAASVKKLLEVTHAPGMIDTVFAQLDALMRNNMQQALQGQPVSAEERKIFDDEHTKLFALAKEQIAWERLEPELVEIYQRTFTQKEIDETIAFYATDTGKAMVEKQPAVMRATSELVQSRMNAMLPKVKALSEETVARLRAAAAPKAGDVPKPEAK